MTREQLTPAGVQDFLARYDRLGPRYTSYPTAPHFRNEIDVGSLHRHDGGAAEPAALSVYVHVPFCTSPCFYCGCNRIITRDKSRGESYVDYLLREATLLARALGGQRAVRQLHLGGGTPNFLAASALARLVGGLADQFALSSAEDRDFSIELDPRSLPQDPEEYARTLARLGFNRVSIGVQDFDPGVQAAVNRLQTPEQTLDLIDACRDCGIGSVNIDLIYGLPKQSLPAFRHTLRTVLSARPDRIAVYGYAHLPGMFKAQRRFGPEDLPDNHTRLALLALAIEELTASGYRHIGLDHFALPDDSLAVAQERGTLQRNFMGYTTHADCGLVGLGVSAISRINGWYSQNFRDLRPWKRAIDAGSLPLWRGLRLTADDLVRAEVIEQLMCRGQIDFRGIRDRPAASFGEYFADAKAQLESYAADGLIRLNDNGLTVLPPGRLLLRCIAMCFDAYLARPGLAAATPMTRAI